MRFTLFSLATLAALASAVPTPTSQDGAELEKRCSSNTECIRMREREAALKPRAARLAPRQSGVPPPPPVNPTSQTGFIEVRDDFSEEVLGYISNANNAASSFVLTKSADPGARLVVTIPAGLPVNYNNYTLDHFSVNITSGGTYPFVGFATPLGPELTRTNNNTAYMTRIGSNVVGPAQESSNSLYTERQGGSAWIEAGNWRYRNETGTMLAWEWINPDNTVAYGDFILTNDTANPDASGIVYPGSPNDYRSYNGGGTRVELFFIASS